jgi:hypothetical protein
VAFINALRRLRRKNDSLIFAPEKKARLWSLRADQVQYEHWNFEIKVVD